MEQTEAFRGYRYATIQTKRTRSFLLPTNTNEKRATMWVSLFSIL